MIPVTPTFTQGQKHDASGPSVRLLLAMRSAVAKLAVLVALLASGLSAQQRTDRNVVYGMYSGLALLMDIHYPEKPNGIGLIHVSGSGWSAPLSLDARPLKEAGHVRIEALPLVQRGYTIFTVNHRATPRFQYPPAVEDVQRAVRFVRFNAARFGIDPERIGAIGGSSGGHLVSMLGVLPGEGDAQAESEIDRISAKVQCVVARATPSDFVTGFTGSGAASLFLGIRLRLGSNLDSAEMRIARAASPITHVTPDDPPLLLIHGDQDDVVPYAQSVRFRERLSEAGVKTDLIKVGGARHGPSFPGAERTPEVGRWAWEWFDANLLDKQP